MTEMFESGIESSEFDQISSIQAESEPEDNTVLLGFIVVICIILGVVIVGLILLTTTVGTSDSDDDSDGAPEGGAAGGGSPTSVPIPREIKTQRPPTSTQVLQTPVVRPSSHRPISASPKPPVFRSPEPPVPSSQPPVRPPPTPRVTVTPRPPPPVVVTPRPSPPIVSPQTQPPISVPPPKSGDVKELVCTVGAAATLPQMYPPDGLCHHLYYTHVFIYSNMEVRPTEVLASYDRFKDVIKGFSQTQGGLAFDYRYVTASEIRIPAVRSSLGVLSGVNIRHYGILNLIARKEVMANLMANAKEVLEAFKEIQSNDPQRKTILAIGLYGYNEPNAWKMYTDWVREATTFRADTVIAISSTIQFDNFDDCIAAPPDALRAKDMNYPDFVRHGRLVALSHAYSSPMAVVGLSLEMGAHLYNMRDAITNPNEVAYRPCVSTEISGADVGCENDTATKIPESAMLALRVRFNQSAVLFDLPATVEEKVNYIRNLPPRRRFSWLYFDLHWADFLNTCKQTGPFKKVEVLKQLFGIGPNP